ncbi:peptide deformylase [Loktanella sp. F6476L]|uniref:peptide deformylase n=1 Tax=Loktanella sp. F6476L TaxID=2926405 RepID=UPI001FF44C02|nr:peptide deformylase [Loktanella sp. F6476L]MCK0121121.1 peptide deformylase [Loktanella sp. F6476L]
MAVMPIVQAPDPVLSQVAADVVVFDDALIGLAEDMLATMYAANGRGIAAPQVGVLQRLLVMDATWKDADPQPVIFVNPEIVSASEEMSTLAEGCLSITGDLINVTRPASVVVRWRDVDGGFLEASFDGFSAACVQHEIDHLNGILITDKRQ